MFDLDKYLADLILNCRMAFGERLLYMGLQGSWLRGEAHENSDIDVMVILDRFSVRDMDTYRSILKWIGFYEKSCGFTCGNHIFQGMKKDCSSRQVILPGSQKGMITNGFGNEKIVAA